MKNGSDSKVYRPDLLSEFYQRLFEAGVPAGFPSPADDYEEASLDLNSYMVERPAATFFVRAAGDSMVGAGIYSGDLLVVDRSMEPRDKAIVIAAVDGELTVKRIRVGPGKVRLEPENEEYPVRQIDEQTEFEVWGVVTGVIRKL